MKKLQSDPTLPRVELIRITHARLTVVSHGTYRRISPMKIHSFVLCILLPLNTAIAQWNDLPPPPPPNRESLPPPPPDIGSADSNIFDNVSRGYEHFEPIQESYDFGPELDNDRGEADVAPAHEIPQDMIDAAEHPFGSPDPDDPAKT